MHEEVLSSLYQLLSISAVSGAASGFAIGTLLQPLEIIKLCLIVNPPQMALPKKINFAQSFYLSSRYVYQIEGVKGFWKGLSPALLRTGASSSIYFHFLEVFQKKFSQLENNRRISDFASSSSARAFSTVLCNPLMVLKTRMELPGSNFNYRGIDDAASKIYRQEGLKTFFKGSGACVLRDVPFAGIYYTILNASKEKLADFNIKAPANTMISGMLAGLIATTVTHPFEIARTHLQVRRPGDIRDSIIKSNGTFGILFNVLKNEGTIGLFKGLQARLARKPLSNALTFTLFEVFQRKKVAEKRMI